jgi:hypothetical protein
MLITAAAILLSPLASQPRPAVHAVAQRKAPPRPARAVHLTCQLDWIVRSNDGRIANRGTSAPSVQLHYAVGKLQFYGLVPTIGSEHIFLDWANFRVVNGMITFNGAPLGLDRATATARLDLQTGAFQYQNRHQLMNVFGAIPLYNTYDISGYCKPKANRGAVIPGPG